MDKPATVLIVDDHRMFREGIRNRLEHEPDFEVVGEAASASEALPIMTEKQPAIVILDIRMPETSGIELARQLRREWPDVKILVLSGYDFDQYVRALARVGIQGYLLKDAPQELLVESLKEIAGGGVVLPPKIASTVMRTYASDSQSNRSASRWQLTLREIEILEHLHEGLRNTEIADRLKISTRTVETHVSSIIGKLQAQSRTEAVRIALDKGVIR